MGVDDSSQAELDRLAEDFIARTRRGESPRVSSYARAHPDLSTEITDLFPLLLDLENGKAADAPPVRELGDYVLLREIGRGGMGVVYEAVQKTLGRRVALKILPKQMTMDPRFLERFQLEAKAAAHLQHPNILPVIGSGEDDGIYYFTMQYVDGSGLDEVLAEGSMPGGGTHYENVARLVLQASEGIAAAHARGVLHRDVKPSNLLLDDSGALWISDFGLCKETESDGLTQPGDLLGTFRYMAPERFEGVSDVQGDVYGLGITLYELLTREPAYRGDDREAIAAQVVSAPPIRPRKIDGGIPRDLELIVLKAIARDRAQRYATADALAEDLRAYLEKRPIAARAPTAGYLLRSAVRRHKTIALIGAIAALALVTSTAYYVLSLREKESIARFRHYVANIAAAETALRDRDVPVARRLLDEAPEEFRNWEWHHLRSRLDRSLRSFPRWQWSARLVAHSPDGRCLATCAAGQTRIHDEAAELLAQVQHRTHVHAFDWHPDGNAFAVGTSAGLEIWSWPDPKRILDRPIGAVAGVAFSEDGSRLAFGGQDGILRVVDTTTHEETFAHVFDCAVRAVTMDSTGRRLALGGSDATVGVFDLDTRRLLWRVPCGRRGVASLAFVGDHLLAAPSSDGHVELRRAGDGELVHVLGHRGSPGGVASSSDGRRLLTWDGKLIHVWDPHRGARLVTYGNDSKTECGCFHPSGIRAITGSQRGSVLEWLVPQDRDPDLCVSSRRNGEGLAFSPSGEIFVAGGPILRVFDAETREETRSWIGHRSHVHVVRFSPDGTWVASGDYAGEVLVWHVPTDTLTHRLPALTNDGHRTVSVAFSSDGERLFTVGTDGALAVWDVATGQELNRIPVYDGWLMSVAASHDGQLLAIGDYEGLIRLLDARDLSVLRDCPGHGSIVTELAFQRGDRHLASASWDRTVRLWRVDTGELVRTFQSLTSDTAGTADAFLSISFLPDGSRVAASSADCSAKLWDTESGRLVATLRGEHGWMWGAKFSPGGERLVTLEGRGIVRAWETAPLRERIESIRTDPSAEAQARRLLNEMQAAEPDADRVIAAIRSRRALADDVREAALRMAYRARTTEGALIERMWRTFLPRTSDQVEREVLLGLAADLMNAESHDGAQDESRETLWALGAYRSGRFGRIVRPQRLARMGTARRAPNLHAVDLAVVCMALVRLDRVEEARAHLDRLRGFLDASPDLRTARGVEALSTEAEALLH